MTHITTDYFDGLIKTYDEVFSVEEISEMCHEIRYLEYLWGMSDDANDSIPTGLSTSNGLTNIDLSQKKFYKKCWSFMEKNIPELDGYYEARHHVNIFAKNELAKYHFDNQVQPSYTVMFYANTEWHIEQNGETKFLLRKENIQNSKDILTNSEEYPIILGIAPIPGRIVIFKGNVLHAATPFTHMHRFTAAWHFVENGEQHQKRLKFKND